MKYIEFKSTGSYALISLNRPDKYNSFIREMALEMQEALDICEKDENIRAVLISANGKAFSAGQDLKEITDWSHTKELETIISEHYNPIIRRLTTIEKPIVCAVKGVAAGAGANIALACDIVIASETASFIQAFSKIGLIPDSGGTWILPHLIGLQRAKALIMLGEKISATEAAQMGMIYKTYPDDRLEEEAKNMTAKLAKMPTRGLGLTKRALNLSLNNSLNDQLIHEWRLQAEAGSTDDFREGVSAFLEKRKPEFKGK